MSSYKTEDRYIINKKSERLKDRGIYLWASDYRRVCSSTYRRLVLIAEFWLLSSEMKDKSENDIAWAINEESAEGCEFSFLGTETFLVGDTYYRVGVFEKGYG